MDIKTINDFTPYLPTISDYFRHFYEKEPWGDYKACDNCFADISLDSVPRYKPEDTHCPKCNAHLGPFWSEARCKTVLKNNNLFVGLFDEGALKGWIIGKPISDKIIAIDFMGLDDQLRRKKDSKLLYIKSGIMMNYYLLVKKYFPSLTGWANAKLQKIPLVSLKLYCFFEDESRKLGYHMIHSTTHKDARNIHNALKNVGFSIQASELKNNRVLFVKKL